MFPVRPCKLKTITITLGPVTIILLFSFRSTLRVKDNYHNPGVKSLYHYYYYLTAVDQIIYNIQLSSLRWKKYVISCRRNSAVYKIIIRHETYAYSIFDCTQLHPSVRFVHSAPRIHIQFELYLFFEINLLFSSYVPTLHTHIYIYIYTYVITSFVVCCSSVVIRVCTHTHRLTYTYITYILTHIHNNTHSHTLTHGQAPSNCSARTVGMYP